MRRARDEEITAPGKGGPLRHNNNNNNNKNNNTPAPP